MTEPIHSSFTIERHLNAPVSKVFSAWSKTEIKAQWFIPPEGWTTLEHRLDFCTSGDEFLHGRFASGRESIFICRYHSIETDRQIIYAYDMYVDAEHLSVSLATVTFAVSGGGTQMRLTEQGVYLDGEDGSPSRQRGISAQYDRLAKIL